MKKITLGLFILTVGFTLMACNTLMDTASIFTKADDVYAFEAVTAVELLGASQAATESASQPLSFSAATLPVMKLEETTTTEEVPVEDPIVTGELAILDQYLTMMQKFLGDDHGLEVTVGTPDPLGAYAAYEVMITYVTRNLAGEDTIYTLYYDEVEYVEIGAETGGDLTTTDAEAGATTTEAETTTSPIGQRERNGEFEFEDEADNEVVYSLTGILIVGDATYNLEGKKIVETDEEILILRAFIDHENYVKVRYQAEDGEKKFFYEVKTDGVIVNQSKIKVDSEDGKLKTKLEFVEGEACGKYEFIQEIEGNVTTIKIKYQVTSADDVTETGKIHITATYDEITGLTNYEYQILPDGENHEHEYRKEHDEDHVNHENGHEDEDETDSDESQDE